MRPSAHGQLPQCPSAHGQLPDERTHSVFDEHTHSVFVDQLGSAPREGPLCNWQQQVYPRLAGVERVGLPVKPEVRDSLLQNNPQAAPQDIDEYERLLAERFTIDPDLSPEPAPTAGGTNQEERLRELYQKLFPAEAGSPA